MGAGTVLRPHVWPRGREGGRKEGGRREEGGGMEGGGLAGQPLLIGQLKFKNSYLNSQSLRIIAPILICM